MRWSLLRFRCASAVLCLLATAPAFSVENVRDMLWYPRDFEVPGAIDGATLFASFEGRVTQTDLRDGVTFSVAARNADGNTATLLQVAHPFDDPPPVGTPITVGFSFTVTCNPLTGQLTTRITTGAFSFCHPEAGALPQAMPRLEQEAQGSVSDPFGLVILDENGSPGPDGTPTNAFTCGAGASIPQPTHEQTIGAVALRKSRSMNRILEDGDSGTIGIYFDEEGTICEGTISPDQPTRVYIIARLNGLTDCGLAGAEFRFAGIPDSWSTFAAPNPEILTLGDPFGEGVTCALPCARPEDGKYLLYSVVVFAADDDDDLEFSLEPRTPPVGRGEFDCPKLLMCDSPYFTQLCVETQSCYVNASAPKSCDTAVAVARDTWSAVKSLYR